MTDEEKLPDDPPTARDGEIVEFLPEERNIVISPVFCIRLLSVVSWAIVILAAEALNSRLSRCAFVSAIMTATPFYGFLFSYQLALAIFLGNAVAEEENPVHRMIAGALWLCSFAVMLTNACPALWENPLFPMAAVTLLCFSSGVFLISRGRILSGAITAAFSLLAWLSPVFTCLVAYSYC